MEQAFRGEGQRRGIVEFPRKAMTGIDGIGDRPRGEAIADARDGRAAVCWTSSLKRSSTGCRPVTSTMLPKVMVMGLAESAKEKLARPIETD